MALVHHVFPHRIHRPELPTPGVAVQADVTDSNFFAEVGYEALEVDKVVCIGNEERMCR